MSDVMHIDINITLNGAQCKVKRGAIISDLVQLYKRGADLFVVSGAVVNSDYTLLEGDDLVLIEKGVVPPIEELEATLLARHSPNIYSKLKRSVVGIAGLGGLGSNLATTLARMGVGEIVGYDFDIVDISNINRQNFFIDQIGMLKNDALMQTLSRISPLTEYTLINKKIDVDNVGQLFTKCDIIVEAFDDPSAKSMLFNGWIKHYIDKYYVGASGVAGHSMESISIKKMGSRGYIVGDLKSAVMAGQGLMAPRVSIAANIQANLVINLLLGAYS